ncbi:MAG TPA: radical SAM family heme chaperone HemW [Planctomycetaceae bacterium]|nr:radical SAM family heme chaperone HemW [Planctomycetaceae bacterium]
MSLAHLRPPKAAYLHVPFCRHRCGYCDFTLVAGRDDLVDAYLAALEIELAALAAPQPVQTLFLGGGTPTHLDAAQLDRLLALAHRWFALEGAAEFSVEANPAGLSDDKLDVLARWGVNRISLGVQSFDAEILQTLERDHDAAIVADTIARLQRRFSNISLDLIFGVPGQTLPLWRETIERAVALGPQHISTYGLTFEKGTAFWSRRAKGTFAQVPEEMERSMYAAAMEDLTAAGFEQYELSNFARPGYSCRHNETYWAGLPYFGFGPGAARYLKGRRETNHRSVVTWLARVRAGRSPIGDSEELAPEDRAREALVLGLRRTRGVDRDEFLAATGVAVETLTAGRLESYVDAGLVEETPAILRLTRSGRFLADSIIVDLL